MTAGLASPAAAAERYQDSVEALAKKVHKRIEEIDMILSKGTGASRPVQNFSPRKKS